MSRPETRPGGCAVRGRVREMTIEPVLLPRHYAPRSIPDVLRARADDSPDATAVVGRRGDRYVALSYSQLYDVAARVAGGLAARGVAPANRVAWVLDNDDGLDAVVTFHAILLAGAVNVPLNPRLTAYELRAV